MPMGQEAPRSQFLKGLGHIPCHPCPQATFLAATAKHQKLSLTVTGYW